MDKKIFNKCYDFAESSHLGQVDKAGKDYFQHPCTVADIFEKKLMDKLTNKLKRKKSKGVK